MNDAQDAAFRRLFMQACQKCFGNEPTSSLSETDARALSNDILQHTGLVLGVKSLKNYSIYFFDSTDKKENPSIATLDTLARYVLGAPATNEIERKDAEPHHPYWFRYKAALAQTNDRTAPKERDEQGDDYAARPLRRRRLYALFAMGIIVTALLITLSVRRSSDVSPRQFRDQFTNVSSDSLEAAGWSVQNPDDVYWPTRGSKTGYLTLYTLVGDNWSGGDTVLPVRNLVMRNLDEDCFAVEIQLKDVRFMHNWQQAGIILGEDPAFQTRVLRLSLSYNDFFGGYSKEPEIIIQGLSSVESSRFSKPEEFAHIPILTLSRGTDSLVWNNLRNAALKIEKKGNSFRFLFSTGSTEVFAFKEAVHREYDFNPKYVGLFAMQGLASQSFAASVPIDQFSLIQIPCD